MAEFEGTLSPTPAYLKFRVSNETLKRITGAATPDRAVSAFDLDVREQLSTVTYQHPDNIADGIRLVSQVELWNTAAVFLGATEATKVSDAKALRKDLSIIVQQALQAAKLKERFIPTVFYYVVRDRSRRNQATPGTQPAKRLDLQLMRAPAIGPFHTSYPIQAFGEILPSKLLVKHSYHTLVQPIDHLQAHHWP
jgi:hypothetical protein